MISAKSLDCSEPAPKPEPTQPLVREKVRIRFRKDGPLRFISHNDLLRAWDRLLRRTGLPVAYTQGFHPKPRLSSPLALALGVVGCEEILEIELASPIGLAAIEETLRREVPDGLGIVACELIPASTRTAVVAVCYVLTLPAELAWEPLVAKAEEFMASTEWVLERRTPGKPSRRVNVRQFVRQLHLADGEVTCEAHVQQGATLRPDEILDVLGLDPELFAGVRVQRTRVVLAEN